MLRITQILSQQHHYSNIPLFLPNIKEHIMRQILTLLLTVSLAFYSCQEDKNTFKLEGEAIGFADGTKIFVNTFENKQPKVIDTLVVKDGKFMGTYPKSEAVNLNFLRTEEANGSAIYFPENENMKVTLYKDSMQSSKVVGGKQNKAYADYMEKMVEFNNKKKQSMEEYQIAQQKMDTATAFRLQTEGMNMMAEETKFKKDFLAKTDKSLFTIMLLSEMVAREEMAPAEANDYLKDLNPELDASDMTSELKSRLESMGKAEIGSKAPNFSAPSPDGKEIALSDALGKYTIIDFWASWCKPCRIENPNVVKVYKKYHDKGLNIISVSLDKADQRDKWIQAIKDDNMDWYHVSNLQFWNDPIAQQYSIRSIPATYLLDEKGVIIDKNLRGAALEAKIGSLLGDK